MSDISATVATVRDLEDGEMKEVSVGETPVLLAKIDGQFHAVGARCTHYGAPLAEGALRGDRLVCPWHNACFGIATGLMQEPPALDGLPRYAVRTEGENVVVTVPENVSEFQTPPMASHDPEIDDRVFVILGAGAAGINAAETLRIAGFRGQILMVTDSEELPYDRTMLSKSYLGGDAGESALPLRSRDFYERHDIQVMTGRHVVAVDTEINRLIFNDQLTLNYDALLLATGCKAKHLNRPGEKLKNIFTLRNEWDGDRILAAAESASTAVVIGSSFIGMEVAASLAKQGVSVAVISPSSVPFEKILGTEIGSRFRQEHENNGVCFQFGAQVKAFEGNGKVERVILEDGTPIDTDLVVIGAGVEPATDYLEGVERSPDKGIPTDEYLQVADHLYAAGDIAQFPDWITGEPTRIEHWRLACQHGRIAAHNMLGKEIPFRGVPFFWTNQFGFRLRYVGHAETWDEIIVDGDIEAGNFVAYYVKDNRVLAAAGSGRDTQMAAISELMRLHEMPDVEVLRSGNAIAVENGAIVTKSPASNAV